jgi:membrane protein implicated in regulation of membrane protease activity
MTDSSLSKGSNITDKSLLRCTVKKSVHLTERLIVYASFAIVALIVGVGAMTILPPMVGIALGLLAVCWSVLASIPWYCYVCATVIVSIPLYSFLWCVARDLEEEDWKSNSANDSALASLVLALDPVSEITIWYYVFRFPGAVWHHYRKVK